jgi:soluble lytic murein transglycosylase-like protein
MNRQRFQSVRPLQFSYGIYLTTVLRDLPRLAAFTILAVVGFTCSARELVTLRSGFSIEANSHRIQDSTVVVSTAAGSLEFPSSELADIQILPDPQPEAPTQPMRIQTPDELLLSAAVANGLTPELVRSVAKVESGLRVNALSPKGAAGLMQLMPATAADLGVDPSDPCANVHGGAKYLRQLLLQYHGDAALALAAYNAGPGSVARYGGVPPYAETRRYVVRVLRELADEQSVKSVAQRRAATP